jgi:hypothetical protein
VRAFALAHQAELVAELASQASAAAASVDAAGHAFVAAHRERMRVEREVFALVALVGRPDPNAVLRSRADDVVRAIGTMLLGGGEVAPLLREPLAAAEPEPEPEPEAEPAAAA